MIIQKLYKIMFSISIFFSLVLSINISFAESTTVDGQLVTTVTSSDGSISYNVDGKPANVILDKNGKITSFVLKSKIEEEALETTKYPAYGECQSQLDAIQKVGSEEDLKELVKSTLECLNKADLIRASNEDMGITLDSDCLVNGQCGMNVYKMLKIRKSDNYNPTIKSTFQDIILSTTMFFGTVLTIIILLAGFMFIYAGANGDATMQGNAKKALIGGVVGLLLVTGSYSIVRLVQFLATAGGG